MAQPQIRLPFSDFFPLGFSLMPDFVMNCIMHYKDQLLFIINLLNFKVFDQSELKAFADDKINVTY